MKNEYEQWAQNFLDATGTQMYHYYAGTFKYFPGDKEERDVYKIILRNKFHEFTFDYGDSIVNTEKRRYGVGCHISAYNVLACLTNYDPGTLDEFVDTYGYDLSTMKASQLLKTYEAVKTEFAAVMKLWPTEAEREKLTEIQ